MSIQAAIKRTGVRLEHLLFKKNRVLRVRRYLRYRNAQRLLRIARKEMRDHVSVVKSLPVYMILDTGPLCNLKCPFCPTGNNAGNLRRELLEPEVFETIVHNLPLISLYEINLFNWGEPLLNPHLPEYIRFFAQKGIRTVIHTNFSAADYDAGFMKALIGSGLAELTVSVDGASQEAYEKYRVGGDLKRVLANLELISRTKQKMKSETPDIVYKMLLNRFNQHEVEDARRIAESLNVSFLLQEVIGTPDAQTRAEWTASNVYDKYGVNPVSSVGKDACEPIHTECRQLWDSLVVNADGAVFPCCLVCSRKNAVGDLTTQPFEDVWNGEKMVLLRKYVLEKNARPPDFPNSCVGCPFRSCDYSCSEELAKDIS